MIVQVWECNGCHERYASPIAITDAGCQRRHTSTRACTLIWSEKRDGGEPPSLRREEEDGFRSGTP